MRFGGLPNSHGLLREAIGPDTADGNPSDITLSTHQRWRIYAINFTYNTDIAVAIRRLRFELREDTTPLLRIESRITQTANLIRTYTFAPFLTDHAALINQQIQQRLPSPLLAAPGQTLRIGVTNGRVDDLLELVHYHIEEWIDG